VSGKSKVLQLCLVEIWTDVEFINIPDALWTYWGFLIPDWTNRKGPPTSWLSGSSIQFSQCSAEGAEQCHLFKSSSLTRSKYPLSAPLSNGRSNTHIIIFQIKVSHVSPSSDFKMSHMDYGTHTRHNGKGLQTVVVVGHKRWVPFSASLSQNILICPIFIHFRLSCPSFTT